jgi:cytochrome c553
MKTVPYAVLTLTVAGLLAACAGNERSRNLADPSVPAQTLARQVCANCHGVTGNAVSPNFPNLAAQTEPYLVAQLSGFKSHNRQDPAGFEYMWGISRSLSDEQIQGLAAYYTAQRPVPQGIESPKELIQRGQALFENGLPDQGVPACAGCHGSHGEGNAIFPRLAGQHADYLVKQLVVFQRTDQRPAGVAMKAIVHELTRHNIDDVAAYLQALPAL